MKTYTNKIETVVGPRGFDWDFLGFSCTSPTGRGLCDVRYSYLSEVYRKDGGSVSKKIKDALTAENVQTEPLRGGFYKVSTTVELTAEEMRVVLRAYHDWLDRQEEWAE